MIWAKLMFTFYLALMHGLWLCAGFDFDPGTAKNQLNLQSCRSVETFCGFSCGCTKVCMLDLDCESGALYSSLNFLYTACLGFPCQPQAFTHARQQLLVKAIQATLPTSLICLLITHEWGPASAGELRYNQCFPPPFMQLPLVHCT